MTVVDASVAVKWLLPEEGEGAAEALPTCAGVRLLTKQQVDGPKKLRWSSGNRSASHFRKSR